MNRHGEVGPTSIDHSPDTCTLRSSCLVYRILTTGRPGYLREKLKSRSQVRSRSTRQDQVLEMPRVRREFERKRFAYFAPKLYNELSSSVTGQVRQANLLSSNSVEMFGIELTRLQVHKDRKRTLHIAHAEETCACMHDHKR
ncbi:hypothetical protein J6590_082014 [Homalodisca vitripennis]|nr:hypothetical protein J6590_082014 [Homalodisca vitripennis]